MPLSWALVLLVLVVGSVVLARQVYRLACHVTALREDFEEYRQRTQQEFEEYRQRTEVERREFVVQISELRRFRDVVEQRLDRQDHLLVVQRPRSVGMATAPPPERDRRRDWMAEMLRQQKQIAKTQPQETAPAPTSFERILKDDPDDPV